MSGSLSHAANAEPNLTPILDMVFQLITFFMLVVNFKAASIDLNLRLPVVGSARPVDTKGQLDLLVLNIDREGKLKVYGQERDVRSYIQSEAEASRLLAQRRESKRKADDELETIVVVRADRATPFHLLNSVIKTCQEFGYRNFSLKAMNNESPPPTLGSTTN